MEVDKITEALGIGIDGKAVVRQSIDELWQDIGRSPEFLARLQDDTFASRLNALLQGHIVRRIAKPEFVDASYGHIGEMIAALRGRGESHLYYHNGGLRGLDHRGAVEDLDRCLRSVGWRVLSDDEMRALYRAPNLTRE